MIETHGLTKHYGPVPALDRLDLQVAPGEVFGLLGPNGAGKTTTLRLLAGLARPSAGRVRVDGHDPWTEPEAVHRSLGVLLEGAPVYERLTVEQNLRLFAGLYGLPRSAALAALAKTGTADLAQRQAGKLSKGQRQRVALARALLHAPRLLFLDEPTAGLDPAATSAFHDLVRQLRQAGVTIVLSSHDMAEVDALCDRVAVLDRGRLLACDAPARLKAAYGRRVLAVTLETADGIETAEWSPEDPALGTRLTEWQRRGRLLSLHTHEASLGEVFIHLTGRELA